MQITILAITTITFCAANNITYKLHSRTRNLAVALTPTLGLEAREQVSLDSETKADAESIKPDFGWTAFTLSTVICCDRDTHFL